MPVKWGLQQTHYLPEQTGPTNPLARLRWTIPFKGGSNLLTHMNEKHKTMLKTYGKHYDRVRLACHNIEELRSTDL